MINAGLEIAIISMLRSQVTVSEIMFKVVI